MKERAQLALELIEEARHYMVRIEELEARRIESEVDAGPSRVVVVRSRPE
jgi:hypothetical protein